MLVSGSETESGDRVAVDGLLATHNASLATGPHIEYTAITIPAGSGLSPLTLEAPDTLLPPLSSHGR